MMRCSSLDLLGFMTLKIEIRYRLIWTDEIPRQFQIFCIDSSFFTVGGKVEAKAKVLDILHSKDGTTSTEDSRTILPEKEFKEFLR